MYEGSRNVVVLVQETQEDESKCKEWLLGRGAGDGVVCARMCVCATCMVWFVMMCIP